MISTRQYQNNRIGAYGRSSKDVNVLGAKKMRFLSTMEDSNLALNQNPTESIRRQPNNKDIHLYKREILTNFNDDIIEKEKSDVKIIDSRFFGFVLTESCSTQDVFELINDTTTTGGSRQWWLKGENKITNEKTKKQSLDQNHSCHYQWESIHRESIACEASEEWYRFYSNFGNRGDSERKSSSDSLNEKQCLAIAISFFNNTIAFGCCYVYYKPSHIIYGENCMVVQTRAFEIKAGGNPSEIHLDNFNKLNKCHLIVRQIVFGLPSNDNAREPALWFDIPDEDVILMSTSTQEDFQNTYSNSSQSTKRNLSRSFCPSQKRLSFDHSNDSYLENPFYIGIPQPLLQGSLTDCFNLVCDFLRHRSQTFDMISLGEHERKTARDILDVQEMCLWSIFSRLLGTSLDGEHYESSNMGEIKKKQTRNFTAEVSCCTRNDVEASLRMIQTEEEEPPFHTGNSPRNLKTTDSLVDSLSKPKLNLNHTKPRITLMDSFSVVTRCKSISESPKNIFAPNDMIKLYKRHDISYAFSNCFHRLRNQLQCFQRKIRKKRKQVYFIVSGLCVSENNNVRVESHSTAYPIPSTKRVHLSILTMKILLEFLVVAALFVGGTMITLTLRY